MSEHTPEESNTSTREVTPGQKTGPALRQGDDGHRPWSRTLQGWKSALEIPALLFAICYAIVTYLQWRDLRDNFRLDQRAWVMAPHFRLSGEVERGVGFTIAVAMINTGKGPALRVTPKSKLYVWQGEPPNDPIRAEEPAVIQVILSPGVTGMQFETAPMTIADQATVESYNSGRSKIYIRGEIDYEDIFRLPHRTTLCALHTHGEPLDAFTLCGHGNEIDPD